MSKYADTVRELRLNSGMVAKSLEIRLLGDIEVRIGGRSADVGHARQQCVLVALLIDVDRPVSVDQLVYRVWGDHPPQRARDVLYGYLSRLRQVLGGADAAIVRQRGGYRVTVDPTLVDVHQFDQLVRAARGAEGAAAADLFRQALDLWRGNAFGGLDTPWLAVVRDALDARRMAALLDGNDVALARGRHATVVAQLSGWLAEHVLDERLTGQFMLALYRCGRQADALRIYQQTRQRLADELGADPSPPLRQLHQRILTSDLALAPPVHQSGRLTPRQLPAAPATFTGRGRELVALDETMTAATGTEPSMAISTIVGAGGMGKTWLAVAWAHRNAHRFPDGQLYVNLRGFDPAGEPLAPAVALRAFLHALAVPAGSVPAELEAQAGLYRSLVADRRMLIILDNARDTAQLAMLLPGAASCTVLVTSRSQLAGLVTTYGARPLKLDVLTEPDARQMLAGRLGADRMAAELAATDALLSVCGGLPLALSIVAARATLCGGPALSDLADELRQSSSCLDGLDAGELSANLRAVFSSSYSALPTDVARVFRLLGTVVGPDVSVGAAAALAAAPPERMRGLLRRLTAASLLAEHQPGRFRMHDLVRLYAAERAADTDSADGRTEALRRWLDYYLHAAHAAAGRLHPQRDSAPLTPCQPGLPVEQPADIDAAIRWFTAEHEVLLAAVQHAAGAGFDMHVCQLAGALATFLDRQGHWHDREATQRAALISAERLADRQAQAQARRGLGIAYTSLGRYGQAQDQLHRALDLFSELDDPAGQAHTYRSLARVWAQQDRHDEAMPHDQRALALYEAAGHRSGQATVLNALGWHHAHLGDYQSALSYCQRALAGHEELGDRHAQAATWDSLGYAHRHLGHHQQAVDCYQQALRLYQQTGDRYQKANTLRHLGDTHHAASDPAQARKVWLLAMAVLEGLGHPLAELIRGKLHHLDMGAAL